MGYGRRALGKLRAYYEGRAAGAGAGEGAGSKPSKSGSTVGSDRLVSTAASSSPSSSSALLTEEIAPRKQLPPLLTALADRPPEPVQYLGVSFGLTSRLFAFWERAGYVPVYVRQTSNELTGEHTCIMLRPLQGPGGGPSSADRAAEESCARMATSFSADFARRFTSLLSSALRGLDSKTGLQVLDAAVGAAKSGAGAGTVGVEASSAPAIPGTALSAGELRCHVTAADMARLSAYSR